MIRVVSNAKKQESQNEKFLLTWVLEPTISCLLDGRSNILDNILIYTCSLFVECFYR